MRHLLLESDINIGNDFRKWHVLGYQPPPRTAIYGDVDHALEAPASQKMQFS